MTHRASGAGYKVLGALHRGGMGEILLARVEGAGGFSRRVVLKGVLPRLSHDDVSFEFFLREAQVMARLDHPNIVRVFDFPEIDGTPYLAMEYVRGRNLHQVIQRVQERGERIPVRIASFVAAEILRGLHHAHVARGDDGRPLGVIHRDVTPGNVLLGFFGEVKVTDFGIAKIADAPSRTAPRTIRGKARYVAPEIVKGERASVRSDVYSSGVVLGEMLLCEPLFEGRNVSDTLVHLVSEDREDTLDRILSGVDPVPGLRSALRGAIAIDPTDRFATALKLAETLDAVSRAAGGMNNTELGAWLRRLFDDAPDLPAEDTTSGPDFPLAALFDDAQVTDPSIGFFPVDDAALAAAPQASVGPITRNERVRPTTAPDRPAGAFLDESSKSGDRIAAFSELLEARRAARGTVLGRASSVMHRYEARFRAQRPWVLLIAGILIGAATALSGSLLALLHHG